MDEEGRESFGSIRGNNRVNQWSVLFEESHNNIRNNNNNNNLRKQQGNINKPIKNIKQNKNMHNHQKSIIDVPIEHKKAILQDLPIELLFHLFNCLSLRECCLKIKPLNEKFCSIFKLYLESGQVRELNICKEVYHSAYLKEQKGLLESNELFNFYFRSKEEIERMKYFRSVFMGNCVNGVQRLVFEKLKDFPLGLLVSDSSSGLSMERKKDKSRNKKVLNKSKTSCLFSDFETFWSGVKSLEINSSTFCNQALSSALDLDSMDDEKSGLKLLSEVVSLKLVNLVSLSLRNVKFTADESLDCNLYRSFITKLLSSCNKLESFHLEYSNGVLSEEIFKKNYPNISSLCVIDEDASCIKMNYFPNLSKLVLRYFEGSIIDILKNMPRLETLVLNHCILSDLEVENLSFPDNLKYLDISYSKFYCLNPEDSRRQYLVLNQLSDCLHLRSLSIIKVEYIDNYHDFRSCQSDFDIFIGNLPENMEHLQLDGLQKILSLQSLKRLTKLVTLHCFGVYSRGVDNIKLIQHFSQIRDISFDCIQALGRDLSIALNELSTYPCKSTLHNIHIERWSTYDINLDSKMQYIQLERLPSLPNLNYLRIIGYYFENEDTILSSKVSDLKIRVTNILPKLQCLVISSMLSSTSGLKYLKQQPSICSSEIDNSDMVGNSLLYFDFWTSENKTIQKQQLSICKKLKKKTR